jgi:hypothetical protein
MSGVLEEGCTAGERSGKGGDCRIERMRSHNRAKFFSVAAVLLPYMLASTLCAVVLIWNCQKLQPRKNGRTSLRGHAIRQSHWKSLL